MRKLTLTLISALMLTSWSATVQANKLYRWVDEQGRVHFTDRPPQGQRVETLRVRPPPAAAPEQRNEVSAECLQAREKLAEFQNAERIVERDGLGQERAYSEQERALLIARSQNQVEQTCANSG